MSDLPPTLGDVREALLASATLTAYGKLALAAAAKGVSEADIRAIEGQVLVDLLDLKRWQETFPHLRGDVAAAHVAKDLNEVFGALFLDRQGGRVAIRANND